MGGRGVARILALEAVAAVPTVLALQGLRGAGALAVAGACLAAGYLLLRMRGARPVAEGTWLGLVVGAGVGLAYALGHLDMAAGLCPGPVADCEAPIAWLRTWMIATVATAGIGLAAGFLANYDRHSRDLRARRATAGRADGAA